MFGSKVAETRGLAANDTNPPKTGTLYMSKCPAPPVSRRTRASSTLSPHLQLTLAQLENNWAALGYANGLGLCPNHTFDIHFSKGRLVDPWNQARQCLQEFLKSARQWIEREHGRGIERKKGETAYVWVLENRGDGDGHGVHAHVVFHVPPNLVVRFHQLKARWARKAGLDMSIADVLNHEDMPTLEAAKGKMKYMSKDLHPRHWDTFKLPWRDPETGIISERVHLHDKGKPSDQPIYGKKTGVSRNIDAKARSQTAARRSG